MVACAQRSLRLLLPPLGRGNPGSRGGYVPSLIQTAGSWESIARHPVIPRVDVKNDDRLEVLPRRSGSRTPGVGGWDRSLSLI